MRLRLGLVLFACGVLVVCWAVGGTAAPAAAQEKKDEKTDKTPTFKDDIAPLLNAACANCHGAAKKKAGVDVSSYDAVMKTVKASEPDKSRLYKSVVGKGAKLMPPKKGLTEAQADLIKAWIAAGAKND